MRALRIWIDGEAAGILEELPASPPRLEFRYDPAWQSGPNRVALSTTMPLGGGTYAHEICAPFFANLLPEGDPRDVLGRRLGIAPGDVFSLLEALGRDSAGALVLLPADIAKPASADVGRATAISEAQLAALLDDLPLRPLGVDAEDGGVRLSLAGVQDKLVLTRIGDRWHFPSEALPSTHIVKPPSPRLGGSVENEAICLDLARRSGLDAARAEVAMLGGRPCLVVERYDREIRDGRIRRIHQEDFCQALGRWPNQKYESAGGPSLSDCFRILEETSQPARDRLEMIDAVAFNVLIGNVDAHAKNFSLLHHEGGGVALAPLYDLMCVAIYDGITRNLAMSIGGSRRGDHIYAGNWDAFARAAGLGPAGVRQRVRRLVERVLGALPAAVAAIRASMPDSVWIAQVEAHVQRRGRTMLLNLSFKDAAAARDR